MLKHYDATLIAKNELAQNVLQLWFTLNDDTLSFKAGQYILLEIEKGFRQYSIASSPVLDRKFELLVDTTPMGIGSQYLINLAIGNTIHFRAPLGIFVLQDSKLPKMFLATGSGVAPMKSMLEYLHDTQSEHKRTLLWGLRSAKQLYYMDIWKKLGQVKEFDYTICFSRGKKQNHCQEGYVQDMLENIFTRNQPNSFEYYICARPTIVEILKHYLVEKSVPLNTIYHEKFT